MALGQNLLRLNFFSHVSLSSDFVDGLDLYMLQHYKQPLVLNTWSNKKVMNNIARYSQSNKNVSHNSERVNPVWKENEGNAKQNATHVNTKKKLTTQQPRIQYLYPFNPCFSHRLLAAWFVSQKFSTCFVDLLAIFFFFF